MVEKLSQDLVPVISSANGENLPREAGTVMGDSRSVVRGLEAAGVSESTLLRRGKLIRWTLPGNTPSQNEQLGISNVQTLFLQTYPEFDELFPRGEDGMIAEGKREEALQFIDEKIGTQAKLKEVLGITTLSNKRSVPYFFGSSAIALEKSFSPWGISFPQEGVDEFGIPRDRRGNIRWKLSGNTLEQNNQLAISIVQTLFLKAYPEFDALFSRNEYGLVIPDKQNEAATFIPSVIPMLNLLSDHVRTGTNYFF